MHAFFSLLHFQSIKLISLINIKIFSTHKINHSLFATYRKMRSTAGYIHISRYSKTIIFTREKKEDRGYSHTIASTYLSARKPTRCILNGSRLERTEPNLIHFDWGSVWMANSKKKRKKSRWAKKTFLGHWKKKQFTNHSHFILE